MHIAVDEAHSICFDMDDDHMSVRCAYVVLDDEPRSGMSRSRPKSGAFELERGGTIEPHHERPNQIGVAFAEVVGGSALNMVLRDPDLQRVELLMQIHDEAMQTVAPIAVGVRYLVDNYKKSVDSKSFYGFEDT